MWIHLLTLPKVYTFANSKLISRVSGDTLGESVTHEQSHGVLEVSITGNFQFKVPQQ